MQVCTMIYMYIGGSCPYMYMDVLVYVQDGETTVDKSVFRQIYTFLKPGLVFGIATIIGPPARTYFHMTVQQWMRLYGLIGVVQI